MKIIILPLLLAFFGVAAAQGVQPIKAKELGQLLSPQNDTTYVVNFWATWCAPCVKELPHFVRLQEAYGSQPVRVVLVSLDFASQLKSRVEPFLSKNKIGLTAYLLDEPNANRYANTISPEWSGALPATLMVNRQVRAFFEKDFTYEELNGALQQFLNRVKTE